MIAPKETQNNSRKFSPNEIYLIAAFFGFVLGFLIITFFTPNYYEQIPPVEIQVKEGSSLNEIVDSLYIKGVVPSKFNLKAAAFLYGAERKIKAGKYKIPNGLSYLELVELLVEGSPEKQKLVTIPEGSWQPNVASIFQKELGIDSTKFMRLSYNKNFVRGLGINADKLEGYLLPDSYYFFEDAKAENVIRKLVSETFNYFDEEKRKRAEELGFTIHQILTLASIIEAETSVSSEYKTVSGVYHNRLKKGMPLQADPTVQYLIRNRKNPIVLLKDLEIDSDYNTYKRRGFPPGPINNPGKRAIDAALYPEKNNYYYFVANGNGGHNFSTSLSEHLQNVREYRKWQREQRFKN